MRNGQPKKIRQPIIITKPRTKRVKGEEPAVALNSLFAKAITQAPTMIPMISGRRYCTVSLVCSFIAPAVSRTKQAMQIAMLPGLPLDASMIATAAATTPHTTRITRSLVSEFTQVSFIEGERGKTANAALGGWRSSPDTTGNPPHGRECRKDGAWSRIKRSKCPIGQRRQTHRDQLIGRKQLNIMLLPR